MFSKRVEAIKPSMTLAVSAKAAELKRQGIDVINMGSGEPDFDTPDSIKQAGIEAIQAGETKYTLVPGSIAVREAAIQKLHRDNQLDYTLDQILVSCGAKQSIFNLLMAVLNPGDEVIIPAPYWVSYPDMTILCGGQPIIVETTMQNHLKITPQQLEAAITPRTKLFLINSPSNPTGMIYSKTELEALAQVLLAHPHVMVMSDDIYEHIQWSGQPFANIVNACPELYERTVVVNGPSKAYAMTGWRIGVAAGPLPIIQSMKKVQSQSISSPCSIAQAATAEAFAGDQSCIQPMVDAFRQRHDILVKGLAALPGFECLPAQGTFYAFPNVRQAIDMIEGVSNDVEFSTYLLEKAQVAAVPGSAFGAPGHIRLSYACDMAQIEACLERLHCVLSR